MKRRAFSIVEVLVAMGILALVLGVLYAFLSRIFSTDKPSAARMTSASFIRQDVRLAFQKLMDRVEAGIEVTSPLPGATGTELTFKDVLNHEIVLALNPKGQLVTYRVQGASRTEETAPETIRTASGVDYPVARPVKVPGARKACFTVLSPTLVSIALTLADGNQTGSLVATARLRNYRLIED